MMTPLERFRQVVNELRRLRFRVDAIVSRAVIEIVNDSLKTQRLQITILEGEVEDDVEHLQPYGVSFTPPAGAECIALAPAGSRSNTVVICANMPGDRPKNAPPYAGGLYTKGAWRYYVDAEGVTCTGAEASDQRHVLGDLLVSLIEKLTVPTAMGPSGTPINAAAFKQALSKHKVAP